MNCKIYGKLSGRCHIHGARTHPVKGWKYDTICELTGECRSKRKTKFGKRYMRRQARRKNWEF